MKNLFKRIAAFHRENKQYDGFFEFECFSCLTLFLLVGNIFIRNTSVVDWLIWVIWLQSTLFHAYKWIHNRSTKQVLDFAMDRMSEMIHELIVDKQEEHARLVSANRRRKRAEKKLKRAKEMYHYALIRNLELQHRQNLQPEMVLTNEQKQSLCERMEGAMKDFASYVMEADNWTRFALKDGMLRYNERDNEHDNQRDCIH